MEVEDWYQQDQNASYANERQVAELNILIIQT